MARNLPPLRPLLSSSLAFLFLTFWIGCRPPLPEVSPPILPPEGSVSPQILAHLTAHDAWVRAAAHDPKRHAILGIAYAANDLWSQAWHCFSNVVQLNPAEPLAALYLAVATDELGDLSQALGQLRTMTNRFPSFAQGFYRLGSLSLRQGDLETAEIAFARLIELAPHEWRGHAGMGQLLLQRNQPSLALPWLEQAARIAPHAAPARHLLGTAYRLLGRFDEAALQLQLGASAVDHPMPDPWSELAYEHMLLLQDQIDRAGHYLQHGQPRRAVQLLTTALQYEPTNSALLNNLAIAFMEDHQAARAAAILEQILQLEPANVSAQVNLALCLPQLGRAAEALTWAEQARNLAPNTAQVHLARANALLALERDEEVVAALNDAAACDPKNAEIRTELGQVLLRNLGRADAALAAFRHAVELDPVHLNAWLQLADLHLDRREFDAAQDAIHHAQRIAPNHPTLHELRSRLAATVTKSQTAETTATPPSPTRP